VALYLLRAIYLYVLDLSPDTLSNLYSPTLFIYLFVYPLLPPNILIAQRKASNALLPRDISAPSQLFWHRTTVKGVKKYYPCCRSTNTDIASGLKLPKRETWDTTNKTFIHYVKSACLAMGEYNVVPTSTLVPFHGNKGATGSGDAVGQWCPQLCSAYETQMKKELKKAGENELDIDVSVRSHMIFLDKILENAKVLEEQKTKLATAKQKKICKIRPVNAMSVSSVDKMLLARSASDTEESSSDDDGTDGVCERKTELIRPGDVIEYTDTMAVQGDKHYRKTSKILSVDPRRTPVLVLESGDILPQETLVKRIKKIYRGNLEDCDKARYKPINYFKLSKASLVGSEGIAAGIKKEAERVGGIISRNMAELQEKAQADGYAPMDLMNRYKGAPVAAAAVAVENVAEAASTSRKRSLESGGSEHAKRSMSESNSSPKAAIEDLPQQQAKRSEHAVSTDVAAELQDQFVQSEQQEEMVIDHGQEEEPEQHVSDQPNEFASATVVKLPLQLPKAPVSRSSRPSRRVSRAGTAYNAAHGVASEPTHKDDLIKKSAIGLTVPFNDTKHPDVSGNAIQGLSADMVREMIEHIGMYDEPSVGSIIRSLPGGIFDDKDSNHRRIGRHLYRNFCGETDILENKTGENLPLSRRERDIIVYCIAKCMGAEFCKEYLPYRDDDTIDELYTAVKMQGYHENQEHVDHVKRTVGIIFELENAGPKPLS